MTCIVGLIDRGIIWMGGDSAGGSEQSISDRLDVKVFIKGSMLLGFTSSFRMGQLLRYKLKIPKQSRDVPVHEYMATHFVDAVRVCLKKGGFAEKEKEAESGGQFMVGYAGRLFSIYPDYQVAERRDGFDACGCGENYSLGSLYSTALALGPKARVEQALKAAERFSSGVRGPFTILSLASKVLNGRTK